jgi:hypothetical protein
MSEPNESELWQCECFMCYPTPALRDECRNNAHWAFECRVRLDEALEVLRNVECPSGSCPECGAWWPQRDGHKPDCKLAALIGAKVAE